MPYETPLSPNTPIIYDDNSAIALLTPPLGREKGLIPTPDLDRQFCAEPFFEPFPQDLYVPRNEWDDRMEEMDRLKDSADDIGKQAGIKIKDQDGYGWCWGFGTCSAVEFTRAVHGFPYVELSASSVCGPVKNYRNQGGWGKEALAYGVQNGWAPVSTWPECPEGANPRFDNEESKRERQNYKVTEWYEVRHRDFEALMSALFYRMAAGVGLNHWGHLVCAVRPVKVNGQYGWKFWNSWTERWGDNGTGVLLGSKAIPDDVTVVPRVVTINS